MRPRREKLERLQRGAAIKRRNARYKEDRISTLPDEIIHHILSFVESNVAVQTCVLSKRWTNLWYNLTFLNFSPIHFDRHGVYYRKFVTDLLANRNQQIDSYSITIDFTGFDESATRMIIEYAISHNVEQFIICGLNIKSAFSFPILRKLSLLSCKVNLVDWSLPCLETFCCDDETLLGNKQVSLSFPLLQNLHLSHCRAAPILKWSLPSLTTLCLENVTICNRERVLSFEGFNLLKKLTIIGCRIFYGLEVVMIKTPTLTSLTISYGLYTPLSCTFMVSAPKLSFFEFRGKCVPVLSAVDGFPLLYRVNFDICIGKYEWKEYNSEEMKNQLIQKLITLFRELQGTKILTLSFTTIQVLTRLPSFSEYQPSPFGNLKSLNMICSRWISRHLNVRDLPDHVIMYLLSCSPCAKIYVEDSWGDIRKYDPKKKMFLQETRGYPVTEYKAAIPSRTKIDASNQVPKPEEVRNKTNLPPQCQQAMSNVQGNGDGMHKGLGVIPPAVVRGAVDDKNSSYRENDSFSLWEGHQIYSGYMDLLTYMKEKHPETLEQFAPQTDIIYTTGLNMLCSIVQAFSEDCRSNVTAAKIARYKGLFSDLEKWGFNTTWLVNHLSNTEGVSFLCEPSYH